MSGLKFGQKYYYRVSAENAAGISDPAEQIGPLLADDPHGTTSNDGEMFSVFSQINSVEDLKLKSFFWVSIVGPSFDLSAFKNGLEVFVPNALTIRVPITGYPTPKATWKFGDKELTAGDRVSMATKLTYTELVITPSVRPDKGTYTLTLENDVTSISGEIEVNVIGT